MNDNSFEKMGFLSSEINSKIKKFIDTNTKVIGLYKRYVRFTRKILKNLKASRKSLAQGLAFAYLARTDQLFAAIFLLCERGMQDAAYTLLRSILEIQFSLGALKNIPTSAAVFVINDEIRSLKILKKMEQQLISPREKIKILQAIRDKEKDIFKLLEENQNNTFWELSQQQEIQKILNSKSGIEKFKEISIRQKALKAGLLKVYEVHYYVFSEFTHTSLRNLEQNQFKKDKDGNLIAVKAVPNYERIEDLLCPSILHLHDILDFVHKIFKLNETIFNELENDTLKICNKYLWIKN